MAHGSADAPDGLEGEGTCYLADTVRLQSYTNAERQLSHFQAPVFIHSENPHERLYAGFLDGTGNDEAKPRFGLETNVARIHDQIKAAHNDRIVAGYVPGPGTQDGWLARIRDGISGNTYDERLEEAYKQFISQAWEWKKEDPLAEIRFVGVGFSRGASEEAGLARLIEERGIQDPSGAHYTRTPDGLVAHVEYSKPPLVAPGHVVQAQLLFDPVGTGAPEKHDRRPPPSVISGFQIVAADEHRNPFKSDRIIDPGATPDGRFLGVTVAGAHSDIGGSYARDGLGRRSENLAIDYLNAFSDTPFLVKQAIPDDPDMSVVHRSDRVFPFNLMGTVERSSAAGVNERLVPQQSHHAIVDTPAGLMRATVWRERQGVTDAFNAEPVNEALSRAFERRAVVIGPVPGELGETVSRSRNERAAPPIQPPSFDGGSQTGRWIDRLFDAAVNNDRLEMEAVTRDFRDSAAGQEFQRQVQAWGEALQAQAAQQAVRQQSVPQGQGFSR